LGELSEVAVRRCISEDMVSGEGFAVDMRLIKADVDRPGARR